MSAADCQLWIRRGIQLRFSSMIDSRQWVEVERCAFWQPSSQQPESHKKTKALLLLLACGVVRGEDVADELRVVAVERQVVVGPQVQCAASTGLCRGRGPVRRGCCCHGGGECRRAVRREPKPVPGMSRLCRMVSLRQCRLGPACCRRLGRRCLLTPGVQRQHDRMTATQPSSQSSQGSPDCEVSRLPWPANPASVAEDGRCDSARGYADAADGLSLCSPTIEALIDSVATCGWCLKAFCRGAA